MAINRGATPFRPNPKPRHVGLHGAPHVTNGPLHYLCSRSHILSSYLCWQPPLSTHYSDLVIFLPIACLCHLVLMLLVRMFACFSCPLSHCSLVGVNSTHDAYHSQSRPWMSSCAISIYIHPTCQPHHCLGGCPQRKWWLSIALHIAPILLSKPFLVQGGET